MVREAADKYIARGWQVVPLRPKTKECYDPGWKDTEFSPGDFNPDDNIGIKSVGGIVDIDLDCPEAVAMADHFLPPTGAIYGRTSKPKSHRLYIAEINKPKAHHDAVGDKKLCLAEIRVNHQSMAPPSTHPDGEKVRWDQEGEAAKVKAEHLIRSVQLLSTASLIARYYPGEGIRHHWWLAASGFLRKSGVTKDECIQIAKSAADYANDDDLQDRIACANDTYKKEEQDAVAGAKYLEGLMPEKGKALMLSVQGILETKTGVKKREIKCYTLDEFFKRPLPPWMVNGLLVSNSLVEIVGPSKVGKTFFALGIGMALATGQEETYGFKIRKHGPVIYVAAEGAGQFQTRVRKWLNTKGITDYKMVPFYLIPTAINILDGETQALLEKLILQYGPVLIIIDTLSRCIPGADENSAQTMSEVLGFCTKLQESYATTVMLLHHPPVKETGRGRGSGVIRGGIDTEINMSIGEVQQDHSALTKVCVTKQKDAEEVSFQLMRRVGPVQDEHGRDMAHDDGYPITSCYYETPTPDEIKPGDAEDLDEVILSLLDKQDELDTETIRQCVKKAKNKVIRSLERLKKDGLVTMETVRRQKIYSLSVTERTRRIEKFKSPPKRIQNSSESILRGEVQNG